MTLLLGDKVKLVPVNEGNLRVLYDMWNDSEVGGEFGGFEQMSWDKFREKFARGANLVSDRKVRRRKESWMDRLLLDTV
jgi:hypothetical protein